MGGNPGRTREDLFGIVPLEASRSLSPRDYQDSDYIMDTSNEKKRIEIDENVGYAKWYL